MSMFAAEFGTGQVFWSFLWFFMFFIWLWLLIVVFGDIFRSDDLSGWGKALWSIFIIIVPYLGVFVYLIARGGKMGARAAADAQAQDEAFKQYVRQTAERPRRAPPTSWSGWPSCASRASSTTPSTPRPRPRSSPEPHRLSGTPVRWGRVGALHVLAVGRHPARLRARR